MASALGMLTNGVRSRILMMEARDEFAARGRTLVNLLANLLLNLTECAPAEELVASFLADLKEHESNTIEDVYACLDECLRARGSRLKFFKSDYDVDNSQNTSHIPEDLTTFSEDWMALNLEQRNVFDTVVSAVEARTNVQVVHLEAPGGCGKTYMCRAIAAHLQQKGIQTRFAAFTGVAANLLPGPGTTIHTCMNLDVTPLEEPARIRKDNDGNLPEQTHLLAPVHFIIFDEITMLTGPGLDCCVQELERIGFTGVLLISGNDAQLPPVLINAPPEIVLANHIVSRQSYRPDISNR